MCSSQKCLSHSAHCVGEVMRVLIEFNDGINLEIKWNLMLFINSWLPIDNVIAPIEFHLHTPSYVIFYSK